jgi:hypothetical protein
VYRTSCIFGLHGQPRVGVHARLHTAALQAVAGSQVSEQPCLVGCAWGSQTLVALGLQPIHQWHGLCVHIAQPSGGYMTIFGSEHYQ